MTLELEPLETGNEHLAESGWTAGISFDPEGDEELMEEDRAMAERREERKKQACGGFTCEPVLAFLATTCNSWGRYLWHVATFLQHQCIFCFFVG